MLLCLYFSVWSPPVATIFSLLLSFGLWISFFFSFNCLFPFISPLRLLLFTFSLCLLLFLVLCSFQLESHHLHSTSNPSALLIEDCSVYETRGKVALNPSLKMQSLIFYHSFLSCLCLSARCPPFIQLFPTDCRKEVDVSSVTAILKSRVLHFSAQKPLPFCRILPMYSCSESKSYHFFIYFKCQMNKPINIEQH